MKYIITASYVVERCTPEMVRTSGLQGPSFFQVEQPMSQSREAPISPLPGSLGT